jgi:hypothetical protein
MHKWRDQKFELAFFLVGNPQEDSYLPGGRYHGERGKVTINIDLDPARPAAGSQAGTVIRVPEQTILISPPLRPAHLPVVGIFLDAHADALRGLAMDAVSYIDVNFHDDSVPAD